MNLISAWFRRQFADPQVVSLTAFLAVGFAVVFFFGNMLAPLIASIIIAYLLEGLVKHMQRLSVPRMVSVLIVFIGFMALLVLVLFGLLPLLSQQISQLAQQLPDMVSRGQELLLRLPERYPHFISRQQVLDLMSGVQRELGAMGRYVLSLSLSSVVSLLTLAVYLVLMPLLVFFLLKDKDKIFHWLRGFYPSAMGLTSEVWHDVDRQIGNYVRGKIMEIAIVWVASYVTFAVMKLPFAMLMGFLVGLSVIVPYIGAVVVTVPVAALAYFQWGLGADFVYLMVAYLVVQGVDGNVIVPLLFYEVVNLHPVAIITAILVFGGLWGLWGVFFAIPLATVVQAVLKAWPREPKELPPPVEDS
ncbi:MAG: AI-2E family transporter [Gammaproteobacteria bacterium]